jgi:hypothetical protein
MKLSSIGAAYGYDKNSHLIAARFRKSYSAIYRSWDSIVVSQCRNIYDSLAEHEQGLKEYGLKRKNLEELRQLIDQFAKIYIMPRGKRINRKTMTDILGKYLNEASCLLKERMDKMMVCFEQFPDFHRNYFESRRQKAYPRMKMSLDKKIKQFYTAPQVKVKRSKKKREEVAAA